MSIRILIDPPKKVRPKGALRADVAWKLFLPDAMGNIPHEWGKESESFKRWLWVELSRKLGFLRKDPVDPVYILTPQLTAEGKNFLIRLCSFWSNEVYATDQYDGNRIPEVLGDNLWIPPLVNAMKSPEEDPTLTRITEIEQKAVHTLLSPVLGCGRSNIRTYNIPPNMTFARFHSHTSREELYFVLSGKGTARIADHNVDISEGDLIAKPTGPDISTQLLTDKGVDLRILDIEIWPDAEKNSKDVVHYPDHGELSLVGEGWDIIFPSGSAISNDDSMKNYDSGYFRHKDGTWEPKDVPGFKRREK